MLFIKRDFREKQLPNAAVKNKLRTGKREGILAVEIKEIKYEKQDHTGICLTEKTRTS